MRSTSAGIITGAAKRTLPSPVLRDANLFIFLSMMSDLSSTNSSGLSFGASSWLIKVYDIAEDRAALDRGQVLGSQEVLLDVLVTVFAVHFDEDCVLSKVISPVAWIANDRTCFCDAHTVPLKVLAGSAGLMIRGYFDCSIEVLDKVTVEYLSHARFAGEGKREIAVAIQHFEESLQSEVVPGSVQSLDFQRRYEVADAICKRNFVQLQSVLTNILEDESFAAGLARHPHQIARRYQVQAVSSGTTEIGAAETLSEK
jgi:hypothetical protein